MGGGTDARQHDQDMRPAGAADEEGLVWHKPGEAPFQLAGFWWYGKMPKLDHQVMNIRHTQHHAAQLGDRLKLATGTEVGWVGGNPVED